MKTVVKTFRSILHGDLYRLRFQESGTAWTVFVEKCPVNPIGGTAHDTHILADNQLCLTEVPLSLERAVALAYTWIHYYSNYIRTGSTTQVRIRANVKDEPI